MLGFAPLGAAPLTPKIEALAAALAPVTRA